MMELTIDGAVYQFKFGMGFLREEAYQNSGSGNAGDNERGRSKVFDRKSCY